MRSGFAGSVSVELTAAEADRFVAAEKWLAVAAEYGSGIEKQRHSIDECRGFLQGRVEVFRLFHTHNPEAPLPFDGDIEDIRLLVSCERYLDRLFLTQKSAESSHRPRGNWNKRNGGSR